MFEHIIGNEQIKNILQESIKRNKTSHSYLFVGIEGIGKKIVAKEFSKMLLCIEENKQESNCKSCIEFNSNNHPDFLLLEPEGNVIKIEQIRQLQKRIQEKPIISHKKVYIINDADKMTKEAQNCLLKTLEEPPEFSTIILIGTNENAFLSTIKSRCMILHFQKIEDEKIKQYLSNQLEENNITENMLKMFQGSIGKAIKLKDKQELYNKIENIIENLNKKDLIDVSNSAEIIYQSKEEIMEILEYMNVLLFEKAKTNAKWIKGISIVEETKKRLQQNANYDMCIDNLLFNMWEEIN